ncbi:MAG: hypothetical protein SFU98_18190 [Leptospiraceae bacterium]|nr:hypothetical protein [Leptospiraceae bacterium]
MEIVEAENLWKTAKTLFDGKSVQLLSSDGTKSSPAQIQVWKDGFFLAKTENKETNLTKVLATRKNGKLFLCVCDAKGLDEKGLLILAPKKINVKEDQQKGNSDNDAIKEGVFASNVISLTDVTVFLGDDHIKEVIRSNSKRLQHLFDKYNVIITDKQEDRIRLMKSFDQPILILNRDDPNMTPKNSVPFHEYVRLMKNDKNAHSFKAEICVPIKYRNHIIIGYVQVLNSGRLDLNSFNLVSLVASTIKKEISDYNNFEESKEICKVTSINETEVTFNHSLNKHFSRIFQMSTYVILDLYNKKSKTTIKGFIKAMKPMDKYFAVTVQYQNLSIDQYEKIEAFVEYSNSEQ